MVLKILVSWKNSWIIILYFLLFLILVLAFIERTIGIFSGNILFLFDNARDLLYVQKIVIEHKILLIGPSSGGLQGYFHGVFWYYLLTIPFLLGNGNPAAITTFVAILSTFSIVLIFFVMRKIAGMYAAIFGSIVYSFASFSVATAKFPWNPYPIVWVMPLYFLGLYLFTKKQPIGTFLIAFLTGLFIHFEAIYGICLLPIFLFILIKTLVQKQTAQIKAKEILITLFLFFVPFIPTLLFDIRHQFLITSSLAKTVVSGGSNITHSATEIPLSLQTRVRLRTRDLYTYTINTISDNLFINIIFAFIFLCGFIYFVRKKERQKLYLLSLCTATCLIPYFFFLNIRYAVWSYYWIGNAPLYTLMLAYILGITFPTIKHAKYIFSILCLLLIIAYNPFKYILLWPKGELQAGTQVLSTQERITKTIYQDVKNQPFSVYVATPPTYDYIYRYLFSWIARTQQYKMPQDQKQKTMYIILETMPSDPDGTFFKKNVVHTTARPLKVWKFPQVKVEKIIPQTSEQAIDPNYFPQL